MDNSVDKSVDKWMKVDKSGMEWIKMLTRVDESGTICTKMETNSLNIQKRT